MLGTDIVEHVVGGEMGLHGVESLPLPHRKDIPVGEGTREEEGVLKGLVRPLKDGNGQPLAPGHDNPNVSKMCLQRSA